MGRQRLFITDHDLAGLTRVIARTPVHSAEDGKYVKDLRGELQIANVVHWPDLPPDVITMNSIVVLKDLDTGEEIICTLVYPREANIEEKQISVLAPVGTAIIGHMVGDVVEWQVPAGMTRLKIERILYRPEQVPAGRGITSAARPVS
jgi:regulator of nucleoside diphosphate kinase